MTRESRQQIDRVANPGINVAFIPFPLKDAHNRASTLDDRRPFLPAIGATLRRSGPMHANIATLASLVTRGDFVRVDTTIPEQGHRTGPVPEGGGNNPEAAFPNGRRMGDDVIDTILTVVTNG